MSDDKRVTQVGKRLFLDGGWFANCVSEEAAFVLAWCINTATIPRNMRSYHVADAETRRVQEFLA